MSWTWEDIRAEEATYGPAPRNESSVYKGDTSSADTGGQDWTEDAYLAHGAYSGGDVEGYSIDRELSDSHTTTYINNSTKKVTVAFAGTNVNPSHQSLLQKGAHSLGDINSDFSIAGGGEESSSQFKEVDNRMKSIIAKYGRENIHTTGHSLGGTKAIYASSKYGVNSTSFNPGFSPFDVASHSTNAFGTKWDFSRSHAYIVPGDPVAASAYAQPGLKVTSLNKPEKLAKLRSDFQSKAYEQAAGVTMGEILATIHPAAAAAYGAAGVYTVGKDVYALHSSDNFLGTRKQMPMPTIHARLPVMNSNAAVARDRRHRTG